MTDRETAYHGHQTDAERLDDIRRRHDALRAHSGETDYAHRVIMDCAWLLAQVEALRAQAQELQALGVSLHKAADAGYRQGHEEGFEDGRDDERDAVVEWLRDCSSDVFADAIQRGEHRVAPLRLVDIPRACE